MDFPAWMIEPLDHEAKLLAYALSSYCDAIDCPAHTEERLTLAGEMVRHVGIGSAVNFALQLSPERAGTVHGLLGPKPREKDQRVETKDGSRSASRT